MKEQYNLKYAELCKQLGDIEFHLHLYAYLKANLLKQIDELNKLAETAKAGEANE